MVKIGIQPLFRNIIEGNQSIRHVFSFQYDFRNSPCSEGLVPEYSII
jgi:hypothetical protein